MMKYNEIYGDLFSCPKDYSFVHCISSDFVLGKGIAKTFNELGVRNELIKTYPINAWYGVGYCLDTIVNNRTTYNLVTKERYFDKPTYTTMYQALLALLSYCTENNVKKLAMPKIGCGLDKLNWEKVKSLIIKVFNNTDIDLRIYYL